MKFATEPIRHYPLHLRYVALHNLGKLKLEFSADVDQQMWKKMQTTCIFIAFNFIITYSSRIFNIFGV